MEPSGLVPRYNKNEWPTLTKKGGRIWLVFLQREKSPFLLENNRMVWGTRLTIFFWFTIRGMCKGKDREAILNYHG
jgi:hypothetical protein